MSLIWGVGYVFIYKYVSNKKGSEIELRNWTLNEEKIGWFFLF